MWVYRAALTGTPAQLEARLAEHGWTRVWQDGISFFHHDHSTAHEVLVVARGQATVLLGGAGGPQVEVGVGDVLVLPAGTGHGKAGSSADFLVGAYAGARNGTCDAPKRPTRQRPRAALCPCARPRA